MESRKGMSINDPILLDSTKVQTSLQPYLDALLLEVEADPTIPQERYFQNNQQKFRLRIDFSQQEKVCQYYDEVGGRPAAANIQDVVNKTFSKVGVTLVSANLSQVTVDNITGHRATTSVDLIRQTSKEVFGNNPVKAVDEEAAARKAGYLSRRRSGSIGGSSSFFGQSKPSNPSPPSSPQADNLNQSTSNTAKPSRRNSSSGS